MTKYKKRQTNRPNLIFLKSREHLNVKIHYTELYKQTQPANWAYDINIHFNLLGNAFFFKNLAGDSGLLIDDVLSVNRSAASQLYGRAAATVWLSKTEALVF